MSSSDIRNNTPVVEFFQLNGRKIKCFCNPSTISTERYQVIEIAVRGFEEWLDENGYLEVKEEVYASADDTKQRTIQWSYTIDEFLHTSTHCYDINDLLSRYIQEKL